MLSDLKVVMIDTKKELNVLSSLMEEQYEAILSKDIFKMTDIEKDMKKATNNIAYLELKRREILQDRPLNDVLDELDNEELLKLQGDITVVINILQMQKDSNMKLLKQLLYFSKKMINAIKPVDTYSGTYNKNGQIG